MMEQMGHAEGFGRLFVLFLAAYTVILGSSYTVQHHFNPADTRGLNDTTCYMRMAEGDYTVRSTARYRVITPMIVQYVLHPLLTKTHHIVWSHRDPDPEWLRKLSFFFVNSTLMALTGVLIFKLCLLYKASAAAAACGALSFLLSWHTSYFAGTPLMDAPYLCLIACAFYGIRANSRVAILLAVFLGPLIKESFIFFLPVIFFYGRLSKVRKGAWIVLSGVVVLLVRAWVDRQVDTSQSQAIATNLSHIHHILPSLKAMLSVRQLVELWQAFGFFNLILLCGFIQGKRKSYTWLAGLDAPIAWLLVITGVHMLLSGNLSRMAFVAAPGVAVAIALILDTHPVFKGLREVMRFRAAS